MKCIFVGFYWNLRVSWARFEEKSTRKIDTTSSYLCMFCIRTVRRIGKQNGKFFIGVSKTKKKKTHEIEFHNSIQD